MGLYKARDPLRIIVNDYSGHPFQVQLSRELARRGHNVLHVFSADFQTPKGNLQRTSADPVGFDVLGITLGKRFPKENLLRRRGHEIAYGRMVASEIAKFAPDAVIGCNNPLDAQRLILAATKRNQARFIFWLQDIYSLAIDDVLSRKLGVIGHLAGLWYQRLEKSLLRRSDSIVAITPQFGEQLRHWSIDDAHVTVIPNWAPLDEIVVGPQQNAWSMAHGLAGKKIVLYTGTLGFKHNPLLLIELAEAYRHRADVRVVVVSEGQGAELIRRESAQRGLSNIMLLPFQPMQQYSEVLASADVLVSIIERDAARFSVPSKVLSYLCSKRPLVLAVPHENLAARLVVECGAGKVVEPNDGPSLVSAISGYLDCPEQSQRAAAAARSYAEDTFDIGAITTQFEEILSTRLASPAPARQTGATISFSSGDKA